jgi:hypothetical protein
MPGRDSYCPIVEGGDPPRDRSKDNALSTLFAPVPVRLLRKRRSADNFQLSGG